MYNKNETDIIGVRFKDENISLREKLIILSNTYGIPLKNIWNEYGKLYYINSDFTKFQYLNTWICKQKGLI